MSAEIGTDIQKAAELLIEGKVVGIPTETVYGLAANALNTDAVADIFRIKNRPDFDPLIVHIADISQVELYASLFHEKAVKLAEAFWPGPLTLVLPKRNNIPFSVTSGLDTVGLRIPRHSLTLELLKQLPFPLAAPSANPFGYISPTIAQHVADQLGELIPYILDGGPCTVGVESTIVGFDKSFNPVIYRKGMITLNMIERVVGKTQVFTHSQSNPQAPGMLTSHYAPRTPLKIISSNDNTNNFSNRTGFLGFDAYHPLIPQNNQILLSPSGDIFEAARNLYASLRILDKLGLDVIYCSLIIGIPGAEALNDRLRRASV
ncbi:MAG: L-threonylcarbamoyladenylate synthase [Flavobacteriales bacterium]|nr:L-threonylcarbamoyladenylate synthase [Flavobacteriales bacterium]